MKYKAIIFDLDGTLIHTLPAYRYNIVGATLRDFGLKASEKDIDIFWFGADRDKIIKEILHVEPAEFWHSYRIYDDNQVHMQYTKPYDDIKAIYNLKSQNFIMGVVTSAPTHIAESEIKLIGEQYFNKIISAHVDNGFRIKPDPHGLIECMKHLGVNNTETIYVGNANEDIEAARNACVLDVLVDRKELEYKGIKPTFRIKSLYELFNIINHSYK